MDYFQTLLNFTNELFFKTNNLKLAYRDVWGELFPTREHVKAIAEKLEKEEKSIFRHNGHTCSIGCRNWEYILWDNWSKKGHFPSLYKIKSIYDSREVVICFLFSVGFGVEQADQFLQSLSINNQNYNTRPLYPLHFKESFFRMALTWNKKHKKNMNFTEAVFHYEHYERKVTNALFEKVGYISEKINKFKNTANFINFSRTLYYQNLCQTLMNEMKTWKFPYTFEQEDAVQRMIVLCAHAEREINELYLNDGKDYIKKNQDTRKRDERGTKFCLSVIEQCVNEEIFANAAEKFQQQTLFTMGEAYWRAESKILDSYAKSGGSPYANSSFVTEKNLLYKNKSGKQYQKISLWGTKTDYENRILSFATSSNDIREIIRSSSANTVLIADLFYPDKRGGNIMFGNQRDTRKHSILSSFLKNYVRWCEGKTKSRDQSGQRSPMPYYGFKRNIIIKFALSCGCRTISELETYLEFTGHETLQRNNPGELLVYHALILCKKKGGLPIKIICDMQLLWMFFSAEHELASWTEKFSDKQLEKCVKNTVKYFLYDTSVDFFSKQNTIFKKQEMLQIYYELQIILYMLLAHISIYCRYASEENIAETVIEQFLTAQQNGEAMNKGFLNYMSCIDNFSNVYIKDLQEIYFDLDDNHVQIDTEGLRIMESLLKMAGERIFIIDMIQNDNSFEIKDFYEKWFIVLSGISKCCTRSYSKNIEFYYYTILDSLKRACVRWTFYGGCRNFSISFYKNRFNINNSLKKNIQGNYKTEISRMKEINELEKKLGMWNDIADDARVIRKCYQYLKKEDAKKIQEYSEIIDSYYNELQKARIDCQSILEYTRKICTPSEEHLVNIIEHCNNELYFKK